MTSKLGNLIYLYLIARQLRAEPDRWGFGGVGLSWGGDLQAAGQQQRETAGLREGLP